MLPLLLMNDFVTSMKKNFKRYNGRFSKSEVVGKRDAKVVNEIL